MMIQLTNNLAHDGSRQFFSVPEICSFKRLRQHAELLPGAAVMNYLEGAIELWLDFTFRNQTFTVNNQLGEYWFFVADPKCSDDILRAVTNHFESLLTSSTSAAPGNNPP